MHSRFAFQGCGRAVDELWRSGGFAYILCTVVPNSVYDTVDKQATLPTTCTQFVYNLMHHYFNLIQSVILEFSPVSTVPITSTSN